MREILFRGKIVHSAYPEIKGEWIDGHYYEDLQDGQLDSFIFQCPVHYQVDPQTVGQFTGLSDRSEKNIFEGDILQDDEGNIAYVVFDTGEFALRSPGSNAIDYDLALFAMDANVTGNVFDTTELIK